MWNFRIRCANWASTDDKPRLLSPPSGCHLSRLLCRLSLLSSWPEMRDFILRKVEAAAIALWFLVRTRRGRECVTESFASLPHLCHSPWKMRMNMSASVKNRFGRTRPC